MKPAIEFTYKCERRVLTKAANAKASQLQLQSALRLWNANDRKCKKLLEIARNFQPAKTLSKLQLQALEHQAKPRPFLNHLCHCPFTRSVVNAFSKDVGQCQQYTQLLKQFHDK